MISKHSKGTEMDEKKRGFIYSLYRIVRWFVWLFSPKYRLCGTEKIPNGECVIVGNHCHMYGPIEGELYTPGLHDVWCAGEMMHRKEVAAYAYRDFWSKKPKGIRWFYRILSHIITPLALLIFNNAHTIAVYHDARLKTTLRETVERLKAGSKIVIFPEHYTRHNNIVYDFQQNFVDIARFYHKNTGTCLKFVPMYLAPALKAVYFGEPVVFDADAPIASERKRICSALMDRITQIAVSLPEHTVIPYPNVSKKYYGKNLPLEDYTNETES